MASALDIAAVVADLRPASSEAARLELRITRRTLLNERRVAHRG